MIALLPLEFFHFQYSIFFLLQKLDTFPTHHHHHVMIILCLIMIRPLQLCLFLQPYWVWNFDWSLIVSHPFWKKASNFSPLPHQSLFAPVCTLCYKMVCSLCTWRCHDFGLVVFCKENKLGGSEAPHSGLHFQHSKTF